MSIEHRPGHHIGLATKPIKQLLHDGASITLLRFMRQPEAAILLKDGSLLRELPHLTLGALRERLVSAGEGDPLMTKYIDTFGGEQVADLISLAHTFTFTRGTPRSHTPKIRLHFECD